MEKSQKGFTLVELLVVVAILGILSIIVGPMIAQYRVKAYNAAASADLRNLKSNMEASMIETQSYPNF